jgi:hypothetical protein
MHCLRLTIVALLCISCEPRDDVVASLASDTNPVSPGNGQTDPGCVTGQTELVLVTGDGQVRALRQGAWVRLNSTNAACAKSSISGAVFDSDNQLWVLTAEDIVVFTENFEECKTVWPKVGPLRSLVFAVAPDETTPTLFSWNAKGLVRLNTMQQTQLQVRPKEGEEVPLNLRALSLESANRVLAMVDGKESSSVGIVSLGSGGVRPTWTVKRPMPQRLGTGVVREGKFELLYENELVRFDPASEESIAVAAPAVWLEQGLDNVQLAPRICKKERP